MAFHEHFEIDKETGFLTPKPNSKIKNGFTATQKTEWLKIFRQTANRGKACDLVGISRSVLNDHLNGDQAFGKAKQVIVDSICDDMEQCLFELAKRNPTAAFGILKAYRPNIWKDTYRDKGPRKEERLKNLIKTLKNEESKEID